MCSEPIQEVEIRYKQKDVIVHCKAICKIHIYRIIKSVQTQVACTWLLWGVGRSQGGHGFVGGRAISRPRRGTLRTREPWVGEGAIPRLTAHCPHLVPFSLPPVS